MVASRNSSRISRAAAAKAAKAPPPPQESPLPQLRTSPRRNGRGSVSAAASPRAAKRPAAGTVGQVREPELDDEGDDNGDERSAGPLLGRGKLLIDAS